MLATQGGRKGDLSRFVEAAVDPYVLRQTITNIRVRNIDLNQGEVAALIDEALGAARATFWTSARR